MLQAVGCRVTCRQVTRFGSAAEVEGRGIGARIHLALAKTDVAFAAG